MCIGATTATITPVIQPDVGSYLMLSLTIRRVDPTVIGPTTSTINAVPINALAEEAKAELLLPESIVAGIPDPGACGYWCAIHPECQCYQ